MLANVSASVEAYVLDLGAHHLDLFFTDPENDPPCAAEARRREAVAIQKWVNEWNGRAPVGHGMPQASVINQ